ncbi:MAG: sugar ABC transporter substrate-binding protein [Chloroflexota bacterium]
MNRKAIFVLLLALLALSASAVAAQDPVTIRMTSWAGVDESAELQTILDGINAGNTEYQIVHEPQPADYYTQVQTQLAGGTAADLMWMSQENMSLASDGSFMALNDCVANAEPETSGDVNDYYPGILQTAYQGDQLYGLPWIAQPVVVYYNKSLFDAAGVAYPTADWTWDDFTTTAKALTMDTDADGTVDQYGVTATDWPPAQMFLWQAGGDVIGEDLMTAPIDSPEAIEGMNFRLSLSYNPEMSPSAETIGEQGFSEMFKAGKVAMFFGGAADDLDRIPNLDAGVVSVPKNPTTGSNVTFSWNASTVINANTQHPEEACDALLAVTEGIQNWKIVSPRISQATVEHLVSSEPRKEPYAQELLDASSNMRSFTIIPEFLRWNDIYWSEYFGPLLNNETDLTPEELAAEVRPELEDLLAENQ